MANYLSVNLKEGVDLLFIDTWHVYPQLILELEIHSPNVRKCILFIFKQTTMFSLLFINNDMGDIIMHDTEIDGEKGESVRMKMNIAAQAKETGFSEKDILSLFFFSLSFSLFI